MEQEPTTRQEKVKFLRKMLFGPFEDYNENPFGWPTIEIRGRTLGIEFPAFLRKIREFPVDPSDVFVVSFPKCGTTWMQHIVYLLVTEDFEGGQKVPIDERVPELEIPAPYPSTPARLDEYAARTPPRMFKSHVPAMFLPDQMFNGKIVYCYRNPKDMVVSLYHHYLNMPPHFYDGTFEQVVDSIIAGKNVFFGPWHKHVRDYYDLAKAGKPVLLVAFEELKRDPVAQIRRIAQFLGKNASEELIQKVAEATSFEAMKKNSSSNYSWVLEMAKIVDQEPGSFVRKGAVGDWKNHFTPELLARFNAYVEESMNGCELKFEDSQ